MNKYIISFNKESQVDIDLISEYVFRFTFDISVSERLVTDIYSSIYSLQIFPYRYSEYKNNIRIITVRGKYKVFYKTDEINKKVLIYRVFSCLQNYENSI